MENLRISQIINNIALQLNGEKDNQQNQQVPKKSIRDSLIFIDELNNSINKNLSQSVLDLVNCFICLNPAKDPLTCPKCNNFACKECLEKYFGGLREKQCGLCKRMIKLSELKENKVIKDIEEILNKDANKKQKFEELSQLIIEKKKDWEDQTNNMNLLVEKVFVFQEEFNKYKNEYDFFLTNIKSIIDSSFEECNKKIEILINSLLSYNKVIDDSVNKYAQIYKKNQNNGYDNNIKSLINEILSLERRKFNDTTHNETSQLLNSVIKFVPSINTYNVKEIKLKKNDFGKDAKLNFNGNHFKVGNYDLVLDINRFKGYKFSCKLNFTLNPDNNKKMCFLMSQCLRFNGVKEKLIPMKLIQSDQRTYSYECEISCDDFDSLNVDEVSIKTEALIFTL
jgi:uncharacterized coiled-coil protein SlyX